MKLIGFLTNNSNLRENQVTNNMIISTLKSYSKELS